LGKINKKGLLKFVIKVIITTLALYVVIRKIDLIETKRILFSTQVFWLFIALLLFNISKVISSIRLNGLFRTIDLRLDFYYNLKLYYVGMFYNLFLPGGIGGDGYKVYVLNKHFKVSVKQLISATLVDRISGMVALVFLVMVLTLFIEITFAGENIIYFISGLLILAYPAYYLFFKLLFPKFIPFFHPSNFLSFGVQVSQLICALFILWSLDIHDLYIEYQVLFLISSVVAVLPFTIGGIGARELVFIFGANYLMIDRNTAVAFSLLFFLLTAVSSFTGVFLETTVKNENNKNNNGKAVVKN